MVYSLKNPIDCFIHERFMYDQDESKKGIIPCKIIGFSAYLGYTILFEVLIEDSYLYSDIPVHALLHTDKAPKKELLFEELSYCDVDSESIEMYELDILFSKDIKAYFRKSKVWLKGEYVFTLTLPKGNLNCHLLKLENGQFSLSPNHKINISGKEFLPDYKKNHSLWSIID